MIQQNKDMIKARQVRDRIDTHTNFSYLQENSAFASDNSLRSISTVVRAHATVNVDKAEDVGRAILEDMEGKTANEYVFKRANQAFTLDCKSSVKVDGDVIQIDPQLLFQRLTWLQNPETILKMFSVSNCVATHQHCLVVYSIFEWYTVSSRGTKACAS